MSCVNICLQHLSCVLLMRTFVSIVSTYAAGRCTLHATPSAEDGGQAFSSSSRFCIYVCFRWQLPSAGVHAMFRINVLVLTSKSHMRGMGNRLLVHLYQWKRPRGSRATLGRKVHRPSGRHRAFGSHRTFGCVATISRCPTIGRCATMVAVRPSLGKSFCISLEAVIG